MAKIVSLTPFRGSGQFLALLNDGTLRLATLEATREGLATEYTLMLREEIEVKDHALALERS